MLINGRADHVAVVIVKYIKLAIITIISQPIV